jgi:endonuclease IV
MTTMRAHKEELLHPFGSAVDQLTALESSKIEFEQLIEVLDAEVRESRHRFGGLREVALPFV